MDDLGRLRRLQADEGRLPLQQPRPPNARHCMASAVTGFMRTFGIDEADGLLRRHRSRPTPSCCGAQHGRDAPHPVDPHHRPPPHQDRRAGARAVHLRASQLRAGRQRHDLRAADRSGDPQLHLQPTSSSRARSTRSSSRPTSTSRSARPTSASACAPTTRSRRTPSSTAIPAPTASPRTTPATPAVHLRRVQSSSRPTRSTTAKLSGVPGSACRSSPSCTPTRRRRSSASGPWASTSTPAAPG